MANIGNLVSELQLNSTPYVQSMQRAAAQTRSSAAQMNRGLATLENQWVSLYRTVGITAGVYLAQRAYSSFMSVLETFGDVLERQEKRMAFDNLAKSVGVNSHQIIQALREASNQTLTYQQTIETAGKAMLLGLDPSSVVELMKIARASVKVTGQTIQEAFSDISLGVARQSKMILDNLGIMLDLDKHAEKLAKSLGKTTTELTDTEKKQAFLNATLDAGREITDRVGTELGGMNDELRRARTRLEDVIQQMKDETFLGNSRLMIDASNELAHVVETQVSPALKGLIVVYEELNSMARDFVEIVNTPIRPFFVVGDAAGELLDNYIEINRLQKENAEINERLGQKRLEAFDNTFADATAKGYQEILDSHRKLQAEVEGFRSSMTPEAIAEWEKEYADTVDRAGKVALHSLDENEKVLNEKIALLGQFEEAHLRSVMEPHEFEIYTLQRDYEMYRQVVEDKIKLDQWYESEKKKILEKAATNEQKSFDILGHVSKRTAWEMQGAFSNFFFDAMKMEFKSLEDYGTAALDMVSKIMSEVLAQMAIMALFGGASMGGGSLGGLIGGLLKTAHDGGMIMHDGGPVRSVMGLKQDERHIIAQTGEYMLPRSAVNNIGVDVLDRLRSGASIEDVAVRTMHQGGRVGGDDVEGVNTGRGENVIVNHFNISAIDAPSFRDFARKNADVFAEASMKASGNNHPIRRGR